MELCCVAIHTPWPEQTRHWIQRSESEITWNEVYNASTTVNPCAYHSGISYSHKIFIYVARFLSMKCIQEIKQTERLFPCLFIRIMYINNQKYQILVLENLYLSEFHFNAYTYKYTYFNDIKMYILSFNVEKIRTIAIQV